MHLSFHKITGHTGGYRLSYDYELVGEVVKLFNTAGDAVGWSLIPENHGRTKARSASIFASRQDAAHSLIMYSLTKNRVWLRGGSRGPVTLGA